VKALLAIWVFLGTAPGLILSQGDVIQEFKVGNAKIVEVAYGSNADNFLKNLGKAAITLGHIVIVRQDRVTDARIRHEMVHVKQWERYGPFFYIAYPLAFLHFERLAKEAE